MEIHRVVAPHKNATDIDGYRPAHHLEVIPGGVQFTSIPLGSITYFVEPPLSKS